MVTSVLGTPEDTAHPAIFRPMLLPALLVALCCTTPDWGHRNRFAPGEPLLMDLPAAFGWKDGLALRFTSAYTAAHYRETQESGAYYVMDLEEAGMDAEAAWTRGAWQVALRVPFRYQWGGFMDPALNAYHGFLGLPNYGRELFPDNRYALEVGDADGPWWTGRPDRWAAGRPELALRRRASGVTARAVVRGHGAAAPSRALGAEAARPMGAAWRLGLAAAYVRRRPDGGYPAGTARSGIWARLDAERAVQAGAFGAGLRGGTPFLQGTGSPKLEKMPIEIVFGYRRTTRTGAWHLTFSEDLAYTAPDFTLALTWTWRVD